MVPCFTAGHMYFNTWPASVILKELSQIFTQNSLFILTILKDIMNT